VGEKNKLEINENRLDIAIQHLTPEDTDLTDPENKLIIGGKKKILGD